jgi:hypothetical protein
MTEAFHYDVLSAIAPRTRLLYGSWLSGLKLMVCAVWLDEWEIKPGDNDWPQGRTGIGAIADAMLVMSANAFASEWVTPRTPHSPLPRPDKRPSPLIPLRLDDAEIKDALKQFSYDDWRERSDGQYVRLHGSVQSTYHGRISMGQKETSQLGKVLKGHVEYGVSCGSDSRWAISHLWLWGQHRSSVGTGDEQCLITLEGHTGSGVWSGTGRQMDGEPSPAL